MLLAESPSPSPPPPPRPPSPPSPPLPPNCKSKCTGLTAAAQPVRSQAAEQGSMPRCASELSNCTRTSPDATAAGCRRPGLQRDILLRHQLWQVLPVHADAVVVDGRQGGLHGQGRGPGGVHCACAAADGGAGSWQRPRQARCQACSSATLRCCGQRVACAQGAPASPRGRRQTALPQRRLTPLPRMPRAAVLLEPHQPASHRAAARQPVWRPGGARCARRLGVLAGQASALQPIQCTPPGAMHGPRPPWGKWLSTSCLILLRRRRLLAGLPASGQHFTVRVGGRQPDARIQLPHQEPPCAMVRPGCFCCPCSCPRMMRCCFGCRRCSTVSTISAARACGNGAAAWCACALKQSTNAILHSHFQVLGAVQPQQPLRGQLLPRLRRCHHLLPELRPLLGRNQPGGGGQPELLPVRRRHPQLLLI